MDALDFVIVNTLTFLAVHAVEKVSVADAYVIGLVLVDGFMPLEMGAFE